MLMTYHHAVVIASQAAENEVWGHESCLCLSSEAGNTGRGGILKALGGFNNQQAIVVEGSSRNLLALLQPHWQGLPTDV